MDLNGEFRIAAPKQAVWDALNDPEILKQCIPGCEELEKTSDTEMTANAVIKVGPVKAKFSGSVTLSDIDAPNSYTISGEGKGGAAGFAKGGASVSLSEEDGETVLRYTVDANVGGKLAQLGGRLIDATSKKLSREFFEKFSALVGEEKPEIEKSDKAVAAEVVGDLMDSTKPKETYDPVDALEPGRAIDGTKLWKGYSPMTWISGIAFLAFVLVALVQTAMH
ncbi:MAG: carbon monoxide dehydrogenase subunit G [Alphaproteobacteria bacterium]|jgi:carbon monoxide dehydrogenase subunit G